jgi:hypothetical protein
MEWKRLIKKEKTGQFTADEQTGKVFESETEAIWDIAAAIFSIVYLIIMLIIFIWQILDISTGRMVLLKKILQEHTDILNLDQCRIIAYAVIGGGLGGVVNGFRSILTWHAERRAFGWRHIWKYIILPLLGVTLAAIVYALTRAGIAVIGGSSATGNGFEIQAFAAFSIGALSGYGSQKVFIWLDDHVNKLFQISPVAEVKAPDLKGKTEQEVKDALRKLKLNLGTISEQISSDESEINKVVMQSPPAGTKIPKAGSVSITIAKQK